MSSDPAEIAKTRKSERDATQMEWRSAAELARIADSLEAIRGILLQMLIQRGPR